MPTSLAFTATTPSNYLALALDVTSPVSITAAFAAALARFYRIDVVVNNAGYGLAGALEELSDEQIAHQMDVNFFGVVRITRAAICAMRESNSPPGGLIQQITSTCGHVGMPLLSSYCASKWAVEGFTESFAKEMQPEWGIRFMCVEPGGFRTDWAGRSMAFPDNERKLAAYAHLDARKAVERMAQVQRGDPAKGAEAIYRLTLLEDPPLRVPMGKEAFERMEEKIRHYSETYRQCEDVAKYTDIQ